MNTEKSQFTPKSRVRLWRVSFIFRVSLAVLLVCGLIGLGGYWLQGNRCILALRGTNATLTIEGWGAQEECNRILAELGPPVSQWPGLVRVPQSYTSFQLCQQVSGLTTYTVHGQAAAYGGIGLQLCSMHPADPIYPGDLPPDKDAIDFFPH